MQAVILCGGLGTRLRPLTDTIPKPMIEIGGKPILEHLVLMCKKCGITDIYFAGFYLVNKITEYFGNGNKWGVSTTMNIENPQMGSAGAIKLIENKLNETFVVLNGDVMASIDLEKMGQYHKQKKSIATFIVHKSSHPYDSELIDVDDNWQVKGFLPPPKPGDNFKNLTKSGTVIFEPEALKYIPPQTFYSIEKELLPDLIQKKLPVFAYYSDEYSKDMGTPERLEQVRNDYEQGKIAA